MFLKLFSLFLLIPLLELYLLLKVGEIIGSFNTVLIILITASFGAYLAKSQGFLVLRQIKTATAQGYMPGNELLHGFFVLIGGFALLTPGFLTDAAGFSMLIPQIREIYVGMARKIIQQKLQSGQWQVKMYSGFK
ncbi:MAG: membrane protein FxsA [Methanosarcinaceae archaeon]|nr:membrane protein FxsA [Methanosarcinaceae archaeon]MDD4332258.1 membrane protein FxsA [Methanosarcinaceae archaeon]MDD4748961.1 membrane protein FxsA [Methanosarcinaceae archaeon]